MNGTYLVGAGQSSPNYTTITAAVADLNTVGIGNSVVFELTDTAYRTTSGETFPIVINPIAGATPTKTLTIRPATSVTPKIEGSAASIIRLNGADFVTINGSNNNTTTRDLSIINTSTGTAAVIHLASSGTGLGAQSNTIKNCIVEGGIYNSTANFGIFAAGATIGNTASGDDNDSLTVDNCEIRKTGWGIYVRATVNGSNHNIKILNNNIGHSILSNTVGNVGIYLQQANGVEIVANKLKNIASTNTGSQTNFDGPEGILLETGVSNALIERNVIDTVYYMGTGGYGGKGLDVIGGTNIQIRNNMLSRMLGDGWTTLTVGGDGICGIRIGGSSTNVLIYYNTVYLSGTISRTATADISAAIVTEAGCTGINGRNNIFMNTMVNTTGTAKAYSVYSTITSPTASVSNYNNYYVSGTQGVFGYITADVTSLANWRSLTGQDQNSKNVNVNFSAVNDLHLTGASLGDTALVATPISGITTDIDGQTRDAFKPYMGADEDPSNPLPVTWLSFTGKWVEPFALLNWVTADELNNAYFEIERSLDKNQWLIIGSVKGKGTTTSIHSYQFTDISLAALSKQTSVVFYRLKQVDVDGNISYSEIVVIELGKSSADEIKVYPNPFNNVMVLEIPVQHAGTAQINLVDLQGKVVSNLSKSLDKGFNLVTVDNLEGLPYGVYVVKIKSDSETATFKLIKN